MRMWKACEEEEKGFFVYWQFLIPHFSWVFNVIFVILFCSKFISIVLSFVRFKTTDISPCLHKYLSTSTSPLNKVWKIQVLKNPSFKGRLDFNLPFSVLYIILFIVYTCVYSTLSTLNDVYKILYLKISRIKLGIKIIYRGITYDYVCPIL